MSIEQINQLTDEDMEHIAEELYNRYHPNDFGEDAVFVTRLHLAEKGGNPPPHEALDPGT